MSQKPARSEIDRKFMRMDFSSRENIYALIRYRLAGTFHEQARQMGLVQSKRTKRFKCCNASAHKNGDADPSLDINDATGHFHCFACKYEGGFYSLYQKCGQHLGLYHERYIKLLGMEAELDAPDMKLRKEVQAAKEEFEKWSTDNGFTSEKSSVESCEPLNIDEYNLMVANLLEHKPTLDYLYQTRHITPEIVNKYRLGLKSDMKTICFPMFNPQQQLMNFKEYNPKNKANKWRWLPGRPALPSPLSSLIQDKIYFFEGEPDMYCALAFGLNAFTAGSATSMKTIRAVLGDRFDDTFRNKEIVLCLDDDVAGQKAADEMTLEFYPIAGQIKVMSLRKTDVVSYGLDPEAKRADGKRSEKDFTDFMMKNGMNDVALQRFLDIERMTPAYVYNPSRGSKETIKVSLHEATQGRYFDASGLKELEVVASTVGVGISPYNMPTSVVIDCPACYDEQSEMKVCSMCQVCKMINKRGPDERVRVDLEQICGNPRFEEFHGKTNHYIRRLRVDDMMSLIETSREKTQVEIRKILGIPRPCQFADVYTDKFDPVYRATLVKDAKDVSSEDESKNAAVPAYVMKYSPIANSSYRLRGVMGTHHKDSSTIFFANSIEPVASSVSGFKMSEDVDSVLRGFQPQNGESVKECLYRRHKAFCDAAGLVNRINLMAACDIAYFSCTEILHPRFSGSGGRGFVELAIIGMTKTGKSHTALFLMNHYAMGAHVDCSKTVSNAGLIGGISRRNGSNVAWGTIPMNDRGIVVLDETQQLPDNMVTDMNGLRSTGIAKIEKIDEHGSTSARTRKIWICNDRRERDTGASMKADMSGDGFLALKQVYGAEAAITRFDLGIMVGDEYDPTVKHEFAKLSSEYSPYACQLHIRWAYSRRPDQIIYTKEFEDAVYEASARMQTRFHSGTLFVNQEMHVKLCRMAISVASMLYSHAPDDYETIMPTPEHVSFVEEFLMENYSHPQFDLLHLSTVLCRSQEIGDMRFLAYSLQYVGVEQLMMAAEYSKDTLKGIFSDYIMNVVKGKSYVVDAMSDERRQTGLINSNDVAEKLLNAMTTRNFLQRGRYGFTIHPKGRAWLKEYADGQHRQYMDYLKVDLSKQAAETLSKSRSDSGVPQPVVAAIRC